MGGAGKRLLLTGVPPDSGPLAEMRPQFSMHLDRLGHQVPFITPLPFPHSTQPPSHPPSYLTRNTAKAAEVMEATRERHTTSIRPAASCSIAQKCTTYQSTCVQHDKARLVGWRVRVGSGWVCGRCVGGGGGGEQDAVGHATHVAACRQQNMESCKNVAVTMKIGCYPYQQHLFLSMPHLPHSDHWLYGEGGQGVGGGLIFAQDE